MKPDRSNFEIWIADWLAGNLSEEQKEHFIEFLDQNPDLKDEADSLSLTTLSPEKRSFEAKRLLKKTATELSPSQVEYLSVAYLEQDISSGQLEDLNNCISNNPESQKIFESVRKIKLVAPDRPYIYKDRLRKKSTFEKILNLAYPVLRVAAAVAIIILSIVFVPKFLSVRQNKIAINAVKSDEPVILYSNVLTVPEERISNTEPAKKSEISGSTEKIEVKFSDYPVMAELPWSDSAEILPVIIREPAISGITDFPGFSFDILDQPVSYSLVASNTEYREPVYDDRNGFSKFLAKFVREKILREDTGSDAPVKPYEIASAGINGISKLFGLEMALVKVNDEQGEMKSLYFSSGLLKINAPVKKDETAQ